MGRKIVSIGRREIITKLVSRNIRDTPAHVECFDGRAPAEWMCIVSRTQSLYVVAEHDRDQVGTIREQIVWQCHRNVYYHFLQLAASVKHTFAKERLGTQCHRLQFQTA